MIAPRIRHWLAACTFWLWTSHSAFAFLLREQAGTSGDVKVAYASSSDQTVTNLHSLASSQTWVTGWESGAIDNTTNLYLDYRISAKLTMAASNNQAGSIFLFLVGMLDDSTWPDVFDGTESTESPTSAEIRDAVCKLGASTVVTNTANRVYYLDCPSVAAVFGGNLPKKFVIFITGNATTTTTAQLAASGNQVTIVGMYNTVAP